MARQIQELGHDMLSRFNARFSGLAPAPFETEETSSPAAWANMVTYEGDAIKLLVNRGEIVHYAYGWRGFLALHEIGGHVLHFTQLLKHAVLRGAQPHALCLAIHTEDSYFIEGVAQFLTTLFADRLTEGPTPLHLDVARYELSFALRHKNLTELIEGRITIAEAAQRHQTYLGDEPGAMRRFYEALLRDVFLACQALVYYPSHQALLPAATLPDQQLDGFVSELLSKPYDPVGLEDLVTNALAAR